MNWFPILYGMIAVFVAPIFLLKNTEKFHEDRLELIKRLINDGYRKQDILKKVRSNYKFGVYMGSVVFVSLMWATFWPFVLTIFIIESVGTLFNNKIVHKANLLIDDIKDIKMVDREVLHISPTKREYDVWNCIDYSTLRREIKK